MQIKHVTPTITFSVKNVQFAVNIHIESPIEKVNLAEIERDNNYLPHFNVL